MKHLSVILLALVVSGCVKIRIVEVPVDRFTQHEIPVFIYQPYEVETTEPDSIPIEFLSPIFWTRFWENNWMTYNGITICYGKNTSYSSLNPMLTYELIGRTYKHEATHRSQGRRWGCVLLGERTSTPDGLLKIELEAFNSEGVVHPDSLFKMIWRYENVRPLGEDSVRKLIKVHNGNPTW
jgi:hypothetical protein